MKLRLYNTLFVLTALLACSRSYAFQVPPAGSQPESVPYNAMPMTDSLKSMDFSNLNNLDFHKQTLAMQKSFKKLNKSMQGMGERINKEFNENFNNTFNENFNSNNFNQNNGSTTFQDEDFKQEKKYSKSYPADANDMLDLSNSYGRITVNTWARNEVKVDIQIRANSQSSLDRVSISDSKDGNTINFKTNIESNWNWGNNNHNRVEINYVVYMPSRLALHVKNSYGGIVLPDLSGEVKIRSTYGSVTAERLSNSNLDVSGSYGSIKIESFNGGHINYSYGNVSLEDAKDLRANISYGSVSIGKLKGTVSLNLAYLGSLKVEEVDEALRSLDINSSYSNLKLGVANRSNFKFDVTVSYAGFKYDNNQVNITSQTPEPGSRGFSSTKTYRGTFGKGNNDAQVNIHSAYGSVNFD